MWEGNDNNALNDNGLVTNIYHAILKHNYILKVLQQTTMLLEIVRFISLYSLYLISLNILQIVLNELIKNSWRVMQLGHMDIYEH